MASCPPPTDDQINDLKSKFGKVFEVHFEREDEEGEVSVFVRKPKKAEYDRFNREAMDEDRRPSAMANLTRDCVVYPDRVQFDALLEDLPGLTITVGDKLLRLAGLTKGAEAKKR
jgi:hypothetical protein